MIIGSETLAKRVWTPVLYARLSGYHLPRARPATTQTQILHLVVSRSILRQPQRAIRRNGFTFFFLFPHFLLTSLARFGELRVRVTWEPLLIRRFERSDMLPTPLGTRNHRVIPTSRFIGDGVSDLDVDAADAYEPRWLSHGCPLCGDIYFRHFWHRIFTSSGLWICAVSGCVEESPPPVCEYFNQGRNHWIKKCAECQ